VSALLRICQDFHEFGHESMVWYHFEPSCLLIHKIGAFVFALTIPALTCGVGFIKLHVWTLMGSDEV
jgi:hypothetical protein